MKARPDTAEAALQVHAIYTEWESRPLQRHCTGIADCCRFKLTGRTPYLTRGEALVAARAWKAAGRKDVVVPADGSCPFLHPHTGKCRIYDGRPFGCRTHFCEVAGGPAHRNDVRDLIQRLEEIDLTLGGSGAVNLPTAVKEAMNQPRWLRESNPCIRGGHFELRGCMNILEGRDRLSERSSAWKANE